MPAPRRRAQVRTAILLTLALVLVVVGVNVNHEPTIAGLHPLGLDCKAEYGVRFCEGGPAFVDDQRVPSWDGFPLDADVTLPPDGDGPWPLLVMLHPWTFDKTAFEADSPDGGKSGFMGERYNSNFFARRGYVVLTYTARGTVDSCGPLVGSLLAGNGLGPFRCPDDDYLHFADLRYEIRDTQHLAGLLVDEGFAEPAIAVTGESYGAGQTLLLTRLGDRFLPPVEVTPADFDPGDPRIEAALEPWTSPGGVPMEVRVGVAVAAWSDFADAAMPNGRSLDSRLDGLRTTIDPIGVVHQSVIELLYLTGLVTGVYASPEQDPGAAFPEWLDLFERGEPYDRTVVDDVLEPLQLTRSPSFVPPPDEAVPTMVINGWTDDLFPPSQAIRLYNQAKAEDPDAPFHLRFASVGHARAQNKLADRNALDVDAIAWIDHWMLDGGDEDAEPPTPEVRALGVTCPTSEPSTGPFDADSYDELAAGAVEYSSDEAQTLDSSGGREDLSWATDPYPQVGDLGLPWPGPDLPGALALTSIFLVDALAWTPIAPGDACRETSTGQDASVATYDLPGGEYTILGLPTVEADIETRDGEVPGEIAARLWDVDEAGDSQRLITKGIYRLEPDQSGTVTFQLNGSAWEMKPGHHPKLELLGSDAESWRRSNNHDFTVEVSSLRLTLPTLEASP